MGLRVLVVDDNQDGADTLRAALAHIGHEVVVAYGGAEAVERARTFNPQIILMDLGMPGMDGYETARQIRTETTNDRLRIVAVTGWTAPADRARTQAAGFDAHLAKPVAFGLLSDMLEELSSTGLA